MSRLRSLLFAAATATALSGCVTSPEYYYVDRAGSGDYYYADPYFDDGYYTDYAGYWPYYYSVVWPVYYRYYDPFWSPGFHYGVTWFPRSYFGFGLAYYDAWPWYHHYSPYYWSFWDGYYDCDWHDRDRGWRESGRGDGHRFGSARNEAERLAALSGANRQPQILRGDEWRLRQQGYGADGVRESATAARPARSGGFGVPSGLYGAPTTRDIDRGAASEQLARYERGPRPGYAPPARGNDADKPGYDYSRAKPMPYSRDAAGEARGRQPTRYYDAPGPAASGAQPIPTYPAGGGARGNYAGPRNSAPSYSPPPSASYSKPSSGDYSGGSPDSGSSSRGSAPSSRSSSDRSRDRDD